MRKGWTETTLGELINLFTGKLDVNAGKPNGEYPFFTCAKEIYWINEHAFEGSAVLVAGNGDLNVKFYEGKFNAYQRTYVLFSKDSRRLVPRFLFLFMSSYISELRNSTQGSTIQYLKKNQFTDAGISLPPLSEQERIVDLISSVDSYIKALEQQAESARKSRSAVLHEILSAGGEGWTETTLGEVAREGLFSDGDWVESKDQDPNGSFRLLQLADIGDGRFLNKSDRWLNEEQFKRLSCTKLQVNDLLIARMPDPIGRACLLPDNLPISATVVDVAIIRTNDELLQRILVLIINERTFRAKAESLSTGTTRQRISRSNLADIKFLLPPLPEQKRIVDLVSTMDDGISATEKLISETKRLRSGLLSDLLSGVHEIPESYDKVMGVA